MSVCLLGKGVTVNMVMALSQRDLVSKFENNKLSRLEILSWVREKWKPLIKNISRVLLLVNGWIIFQFLYENTGRSLRNFFG